MKKTFVLPADKYDALELAAKANGGVGRFSMFEKATGAPLCAYGLAWWAGIISTPNKDVLDALYTASEKGVLPFTVRDSDSAVARKLAPGEGPRVPFRAWAKALGLVRGE